MVRIFDNSPVSLKIEEKLPNGNLFGNTGYSLRKDISMIALTPGTSAENI